MNDSTDFVPGETVYYLLPRAPSNGRPRDLYLRGVVLSVTPKRVVVRTGTYQGHRILMRSSLVRTPPDGAWVK